MIEHLRRKNVSEAAEATVEVGKLLYFLGRRGEALQRFDDAIEADDDRDQSYIDIVAFLVQAGETDAALSIYHRALARPGRAVSEYVKVYTSLWVLDLTRRTNKVADPKAEAYLRTLDQRHGELRPHRGAAWSRMLGRYAVGKITYDQALAAADTPGKRAEIYFYEAMRRLEDGKSDDAHQLWQKVVDTQHVLVLRVRHGVALPAPWGPVGAARGERGERRSESDLVYWEPWEGSRTPRRDELRRAELALRSTRSKWEPWEGSRPVAAMSFGEQSSPPTRRG